MTQPVACRRAGLDWGQGEEGSYFCSGHRGYHRQWDSKLFNYAHHEVMRYLLSNLRWWLDEYRCAPSPAARAPSHAALCFHQACRPLTDAGGASGPFALSGLWCTSAQRLASWVCANSRLRRDMADAWKGLKAPLQRSKTLVLHHGRLQRV